MSPLIFVYIKIRFNYFWALYFSKDSFIISHALSALFDVCVLGDKFN